MYEWVARGNYRRMTHDLRTSSARGPVGTRRWLLTLLVVLAGLALATPAGAQTPGPAPEVTRPPRLSGPAEVGAILTAGGA